MTVIDIRNIFSDRNIALIDVTATHLYYTEKKYENGKCDLYILEYNRSSRREKLVTNYSLDDPSLIDHIYVFEKTMMIVLENGSNSLWLIEIDKKSGGELNRRKIVCTGTFTECLPLDNQHLLIYTSPDQMNAEVFRKYKEITCCDYLCYMYDLKTNQKHFVKIPIIASIGSGNVKLMNIQGESYLILLDPFGDEETKENYFKEQRWINTDIRDNIWFCKTSDAIEQMESGGENIRKQCIASADIKALVRYMGSDLDKVYFRAKEFKSSIEKICSFDIAENTLTVEATLEPPEKNTSYIVEEKPFKAFTVTKGRARTVVQGVVGSDAELSYNNDLGKFITCINDRYIITNRQIFSEESKRTLSYYYICDCSSDKSESYDCNCYIKGNTLVIY